jgi:two-component system LytT family response regulator
MPALRTLLVDDEPLARERLGGMLRREPGIEIIGECTTGAAAVAAIEAQAPDLVFLDMHLPGGSGLEVISCLPVDRRPAIVVATAHSDYAVKAFAAAVVDYLLKPFDADRLRSALQRSRDYLQARANPPPRPAAEGAGRLAVRTEGRIVFLRPEEIVRIEADDNHVVIHQPAGFLRLRATLTAIEERLAPARFVRVNRSNIVALDEIKELLTTAVGGGLVVLRDGTRLPCSRALRGQLGRLAEK